MKQLIQKSNGKKSYSILVLIWIFGWIEKKYPELNLKIIDLILINLGFITSLHGFFKIVKPKIVMGKEQLIGVLYSGEEKRLSKKVNKLLVPYILKFANSQKFWLKMLVKLFKNKGAIAFLKLIQYLDNNLADKLKPEFKVNLRLVLIAIMDENIDSFGKSSSDMINDLIDLPKLTEKKEAILIELLVKIIIAIFDIILKK